VLIRFCAYSFYCSQPVLSNIEEISKPILRTDLGGYDPVFKQLAVIGVGFY
jgi:hypothetical protein